VSTLLLDNVSRWFGNVVAVNAVTMTIGPGVTGLLGPNGAGKSTLIHMMGGFLAPSSGTVTLDGEIVWRNEEIYRRIGLVPEREAMYDVVTGWQFVLANAKLHGLADPEAAARRALETVHMTEAQGRDISTYSKGMKQRIKMATALVHDPPVLLLDEPATALDPEMTQTLRELIVSLRAQHRAILLCTHDLDEAQRISDRVVIVDRGRIVREGATEELRSAGRPSFRAELIGDEAAIRGALHAASVTIDGVSASNGRLEVRWTTDDPAENNTRALRALLDAGARVVSVNAETRSLEDAYLAIIKESRE